MFENDEQQLRAGSFARVKLANKVSEKSSCKRAIGTDLKNRFVLTVGEGNVLEYKLVTVGELQRRLITSV